MNVALASNGGVASASSENPYIKGGPASALNDGETRGTDGYYGRNVWRNYTDKDTGTGKTWWAQIDFSGKKSIRSIVVYFMQYQWRMAFDVWADTWTTYATRSFDVQRFDGSNWVLLKRVDNFIPEK